MRKTIFLLAGIFISINLCAQEVVGDWYGKIKEVNLRITFHISKNDSGYSATLDSPDQGAFGIAAKEVSYSELNLEINMPDLGAKYIGKFLAEKNMIEGIFYQGGAEFKVDMGKEEVKKEKVVRPQEPKAPFPYSEEEVTFENKKDSLSLAGTLTIPKKGKNFPAVVLISGSGPQNRDEEIANHRPFRVIADYLARNGIAVLRFDDRGVAKSTGDFSKAITTDFATDAICAVEYLKTRKEIDLTKIGLIGHSEGGLVAPLAANASKDIAFIVMLAGPGITGEEIIYKQNYLIGKAEGGSEANLLGMNDLYKTMFAVLKKEEDLEKAKGLMKIAVKEKLASMKDSLNGEELIPESQQGAFGEGMANDWFKFFIMHDPALVLEKVKCPVLSLIGEKDLQVPAQVNQDAIKKALEKSGSDYTVKTLPGLNHLFQECKTGSPSEYGAIEQTISPKALKELGNWIKSKTK